ncbi:SusC/RagA family TonB-linked outer membrane protein [Mucilaginibacter jinjuensis]|uniref:SusC/RagA family TonB-linked outer membrane protein n=1 Tax=Mucilaginibacter jinjuensis TaxID=1176721 RepID=A0ABY7TAY2_9SPHI|nr:SusC/RagA family TonB-linked outer membrane protein [Mucilaginibacter jinjuensis]WCT13399.1 SusC/RagA family TonB-linked outer membrane protein [Mucilaginibacter jinjuensis]
MKFLLKKKKTAPLCPVGSKMSSIGVKQHIKQIMRISATIIFLIGISTLTLMADAGKAQELATTKINLVVKNESLASVLRKIERLSNLHFVYPSAKISSLEVSSFSANNLSLDIALDKLLLPKHLTYKVIGDNILIDAMRTKASDQVMSAIIKVSGKVNDEQGQPLPGVTVKVKGGQASTSTDNQGNYSIKADENDVLVFTFIGYEPLEQAVNARKTINIALKPTSSQMKEVVVIGYGTQNRKDVTTAVSSLGSADINNFPATGVDKAMTGKLAGVQVLQPNGAPGAGISIHVRGTGTITAGSDPLYVVDGVPLSDNDISGAGFPNSGFKVNPLNAINVNDIESVDVLKDASAAAIYGSRGSNGVVIITTKRGKKDKMAINLNSYYGIQSTTKEIPMLNATQYAQLIYDAHNNTYFDQLQAKGLTGSATDDNATRLSKLGAASTNTSLAYLLPPEIFPYLQGKPGLTDTNWQDAIFQQAAMQSHTLSVAGGSDNVQYYISGNYLDQDGIVINSGYKRYAGRVNLDAHYNHLKLGASINYDYGIYNYQQTEGAFNNGNQNIIEGALVASPFFPVTNPDGTYNFDQFKWQYSQSNGINPVALAMLKTDVTYEKKLLSNLYAEYEIVKDLKYKVSFGTDISDFNRSIFSPSTLPSPLTLTTPSVPTATYDANQITNWVLENTVSYKKRWGDHSLQALAGYTLQRERSNSSAIGATGFPNDLVKTLNGATTITSFTSAINEWSLLSGLARLQYSYKDRYLLSAAVRADGSSRFGPNTKYGYFPSASAGWIVSDEDFMKNITAISSLKLRASYGVTGNFQIPNYAYLSTLSQSNYVFGSGSGTLNPGLYQSTASNPNLGWEKTSAINLGTDISLFKGILNATVDVYTNNTSHLLLNIPVPLATGYTTSLVNIGKVNNKGIEVTLSNTSTAGKFRFTNSINYSANRNKVLDLGGVNSIITQAQNVIYFITEVGKPIGNYYTLVKTGVFKDQADIDNTKAKVPGAKPGDFKFADINGDGVIDGNDKTITGNYQPKFTYGYSGQVQYGIFDLNVAAQGVYGNTIANIAQRHYNSTESYANNTTDALNRWVSPSDPGNGIVARANRSETGLNAQISTYHLSPGSYLRIRDLTFGVSLPQPTAKAIGLAGVRIYFTAENPFTITKYNGYNPEVSVDSNPLQQGVDYGSYPVAKNFLLGLNLKF